MLIYSNFGHNMQMFTTYQCFYMKIDLHTHTYYSDGVLSPTELVQRAIEYQVDVLALTDHDTVLGIEEALTAAQSHAIKIIPGIEISCQWREQTIHMIGLNVDIAHPYLQQKLQQVWHDRHARAEKISKMLTKYGIPGIEEGLARQVKGVPGRLHFARYLSTMGYSQSPGKAFKKFMARGKPGYCQTEWMSLSDAARLIRDAGGLPVIAHPRRYDLTIKKITTMLEEFKASGGEGVEVATTNQNKSDQMLMANLAKQLDLAMSIGSDFHEPCAYNELGKASFLITTEGKFIADML
jgi:predicted metal-dependent phosphoesterase TrpH